MKSRREFFKSAAALSVLGASGLPLRAVETSASQPAGSEENYVIKN